MPGVGTRLGYQDELAAGRVPILSAELVGFQGKFSHRIWNYGRVVASDAQVVVIDAVDNEVVISGARASH